MKGVAGRYTCLSGGVYYTCTARGIFRNRKTTPLVGDKVEITVSNFEKKIGTIHTIKTRENELRRPPAANIGQVIITVATTQPSFNAGLLDRFLLLVEHENIPVLICVNKIDLAGETKKTASQSNSTDNKKQSAKNNFLVYEKAWYPLIYTGALAGIGLDELRDKMLGKINLFAGASGVGKTSLINALYGIGLKTGDLSTKLGRGKHTTRHTEIFQIGETPEQGYCFDTPGFTSLDISHIQKNELAFLFREFRPFLHKCQFNDCLHVREAHCAVKEQIGKAISPVRYESYVKLLDIS